MITKTTILKSGSKGLDVKTLQQKLKNLGYYKGSIDGHYWTLTINAVRAYQKAWKLVADGIAGPITLGKLGLIKTPTKTSNQSTPKTYISDKDSFLKSVAVAIGGKFNNFTEFYNLVKKNEKYHFEVGDTLTQKQEIEALNKNLGLNCVNYSQVAGAVITALNKYISNKYAFDYVRTYCVKDKVGHHYVRIKGNEFGSKYIDADLAAATGSDYPLGKTWCQDYPKKEYNWATVVKNDGIN